VTADLWADVLVIGAGASGGVAAKRMADAGFSVVCLEQGSWPDRASFRGAEADWELSAGREWSALPNVRRAPADYPIDLEDSDMGVLNFNGVGGGTVLYAAQWPRLLPSDFRVRSLDGVAADWPLDYEELLPFYERTDREVGVSGLGGNPAYPPGEDPPLPPLPIGPAGIRIARALVKLGWHWWPESNAILSAPYLNRHPCVQRGTCSSGCGEGAKASTDLTHWPQVIGSGGQLITGARVRRIVVGSDGLAKGAEWIDRLGRERFVGADVVLCAANGLGTPRLLLNSTDNLFPDGLGNSSGLVGRGLMVHPFAGVVGLFRDGLDSWQGHSGASIQSLQFYGTDPRRNFVRGSRWALSPTGGPLRAALGAAGEVWGPGHHEHVREQLGHGALLCLLAEDLPEESNRVELADGLADSDGIPAPKVSYRISENTEQILRWNEERAKVALEAAGAWKTFSFRASANGHLMGTARMGADADSSVVDRWGMCHDVPNLGIIDGSVFVTAGAVNPTSTICALALRTADHLVASRRAQARPTRTGPVSLDLRDERQVNEVVAIRRRPMAPTLTPSERAVLAHAADLLIPASGPMPAASHTDVDRSASEQVLSLRPDLVEPLKRVLALGEVRAWSEVAMMLDDIATLGGAERLALLTVVAGAYYLDPDVRRFLGYPGQEARPVNPLEYPQYVEEGLLERVPAPVGVGVPAA